ncbi:unnamed protein product [Phytophthora fragariaefolia]|uniref:Unnamed protein product n=1 Tax=Phytophthora fragariaefolia TaxID=1490495 RepID=A0A9W6XVD8_9STRA|nr:unnamed protein product [Phytophthora fragariaefolia]
MEIQLNAAPEDAPAPAPAASPSVSHAMPMSSLLSADVSTPRAAPAPARSGLSSLMNSPLPDDVENAVESVENAVENVENVENADQDVVLSASQESDGVQNEEPDVENAARVSKTPALRHAELRALQDTLRLALQRQWAEAPPAAKRAKKSKQSRRAKAAVSHAAAEAELELRRALHELQRVVSTQFARAGVLADVARLCLGLCEAADARDPVQSWQEPAADARGVDLDRTAGKLPTKPVYAQLAAVVRRAVLAAGGAASRELLTLVLDWCLARPTPAHWMWLLLSVSHMNSHCVLEFLLREAVARYQADADAVAPLLPLLELLATKHPAQMVDILRDLLDECATGATVAVGQGLTPVDVVYRLVALASDSAILVSACDDNLQWIVTEELVSSLATKFTAPQSSSNGSASSHFLGMEEQLLNLIRQRSPELSNSAFQLLLLLQNLTASKSPPQVIAAVTSLQRKVLEFAGSESSCTFAKHIYRFLPYMCQNTLRLLHTTVPVQETQEDEAIQSCENETMPKDIACQRFGEWKQWLCLLAKAISRKEVAEQLIKAELMLAEFGEMPLVLSLTGVQPADHALCELLTYLLIPASPEYVTFVGNVVHECQSAAPRARRRILGVVQTLLNLNDNEDSMSSANQLPIRLTAEPGASCVQQLARAESWGDSLDSFMLWKGVRGIEFWESFLDLTRSKDEVVAARALHLLSRTPFLSLENPSWQYRCVRKLSGVFFSLLRQYRTKLVLEGDKTSSLLSVPSDNDLRSRLQSLRMILFRLLALDGGVAHYPSSVYSMFASLWLDALLSTTSATSIPTHFPNGVNFADVDDIDDALDERQVIRSERTISSKCTNLQSSQVITKVPETKLVYRKTLDSSWEREMHAARVCSAYATEIISHLLASTGTAASLLADSHVKSKTVPNAEEDEQLERRLKIVVDMVLERVIPCCGIPSDDIYKDILPNRSSFDVDLRVEQWLNHFPAFLPLLRSVISTSTALSSSQLLRLVPVIKSALIVLLGHWNSVKGELSVENVDVPPYMRNQNQLAITCELMQLLRSTNWLPVPLGKTAELLPLTTPADIRSILFSCWFYLSDHPPRTGSRAPTPATSATTSPISSGSSPAGFSITGLSTGGPTSSSSHPPIEFYLIPLRKALHRNIRKIGAKYPLFMC